MKLNTKKFLRNILICIVAWLIVSFILNYAPGFKRDKYAGVTKLIINDKDVTDELKQNIYVSEEGYVYFSIQDLRNLFDKNISYYEDLNIVVTTSNTKIAAFNLEDSKVTLNGIKQEVEANLVKKDNLIYIPISELQVVYNIEVNYIKDKNIVVIENLNSGLIKAEVTEDSVIKYKPRFISKKVGKVSVGEQVSCYYTTSKGWRLIRTENGTLGYVKANMLENEYIVRQDYDDEIKTAEIKTSLKDGTTLSLYNNQETSKIIVKTLFNLKENGTLTINQDLNEEDYTVWATISNEGLEKYTNDMIKDYNKREELINNVLNYVSKYKLKGININFKNVSNSNEFCRFIIELTPRLRDLGLTTNVVLNSSFEEEKIIGVVDYLIKEQ